MRNSIKTKILETIKSQTKLNMPNSPFTLSYQLQQHSPYIHFQSEQKGATLRATELKPKLDKYLIVEHFDNNFERYKHLLVGYKGQNQKDIKPALDYKVSINARSVNVTDIPEKFPCFFANMGDKNESSFKRFSFAKDITIEFFSKKQSQATWV